MPRRTRTAKKLAQRIDLNYFQRPHHFRRWRWLLSVGVPALALLWLAWETVGGHHEVYSIGFQYRPPLTENIVLTGGAAVLTPGTGLRDIYTNKTLFALFSALRLEF